MLEVRGLQVHFPIRAGVLFERVAGHVRAVDGVDLTIADGATLGLVGESGCGKSTVGKAIIRLVPLTAGTVRFNDVELTSLEGEALRQARRHVQMIFQDPYASLDPRQSVENILSESITVHHLRSGTAVHARVHELLDAVGLARTATRRYPHEFSGGQRQRIGIARALAAEPSLIIADEPVSALDVSIQAQVINLLVDLQAQLGLTYLFISHDLAVVRHIAEDVAVMYLGSIVEGAASDVLYTRPMHPYTLALLSAVPIPDPIVEDTRHRTVLQGELPSSANPPPGCRFHTRCIFVEQRCRVDRPPLREVEAGHLVACHFAEQIAVAIRPVIPSAPAVPATPPSP